MLVLRLVCSEYSPASMMLWEHEAVVLVLGYAALALTLALTFVALEINHHLPPLCCPLGTRSERDRLLK